MKSEKAAPSPAAGARQRPQPDAPFFKAAPDARQVSHMTAADGIFGRVQRKSVGAKDTDRYELQADQIADRLVLAADQDPGAGPATDASDVGPAGISFRSRAAGTAGGGLSPAERAFYEPKLGADLSGVRLHSDSRAAYLAASFGAKAITRGDDVFFGPGRLDTSSREGRQLLAHELTHVVQQRTDSGVPSVQRQEHESAQQTTGAHDIQIPWTGSLVGSLVQYFRPLASGTQAEIVSAVQLTLSDADRITFADGHPGEPGYVRYEGLEIPRFEELLRQYERESWTLLSDLADRMLANLGLDWDSYELRQRMRGYFEPLTDMIDSPARDPYSGLSTDPPTIEFPRGTDPADIALMRRFIDDAFAGRIAAEVGVQETLVLSPAEIDAVRALYEESDEERDAILDLLRNGEARQRDRPSRLDDLIDTARAQRRIERTARLLGIELQERDPDAQEPIVRRPVQGRIVIPSESVTVGMEVPIQFQITNGVDAFRVPHVSIQWRAIQRRDGQISVIESDTTNYIEVREHGLLNERIFEVEFDRAGTYEIHAIVSHNFYMPDAFEAELVVSPVSEVLDRLRTEGDADFGNAGTRPSRVNYDFEGLSDIGDYDEGYRYEGQLSEARFAASSGSFLDSYAGIDRSIGRLDGLIDHYRRIQAEQGQNNQDLIDWATGRLGRLRETRRQLERFERGEDSLPIAIRAYYASQTASVAHRQLDLVAWFDHVRYTDGSEEYAGHLLDHTGVVGPDNLHFTSTADNYEDMVEALFVELSEDYPAGQMSVSFQLYQGSQRTRRLVTFERTTRTLGGDIAEAAFSAPVSIGVNVVAAILTVFPPTTGIGIALGLTYNAAATGYDLSQALESDTLRPSHAVDVGLLFLDILPVIGRGVRVFTAAGRAAQTIDTAAGTYRVLRASALVAEYGGEVYMFSEQAYLQIRQLHDRQITELAELQGRINTLQAEGAPPNVLAIERRRAQRLEQEIRSTTVDTLANLAATQALTLATPAAAARLASTHPRARGQGTDAPTPEPEADSLRSRQEPDPSATDDPRTRVPRRPEAQGDATQGEGRRPEQVRVDAPDAPALPPHFMSSGRPVRVERTERPGHGVRVSYEPDAHGMVTRIWIEAGRDATRVHLDQHAEIVRLMQRYQGLSGRLRVFLTRMQNIVARYTGVINGPELLPGSRAFEAQAEIMKLPAIIRSTAQKLTSDTLTPLERAETMAEIDKLEADLQRHMDTLERLDLEVGAGYVAAEHEPRSNRAALDAGYPPLEQAPGHYYVRAPTGGFQLRRFAGSNDPPKHIRWENGRPVIRDRPPGTVVHPPPETLRPGETRTYTGPAGTTATATRRRRDRAVVITSTVGPGRGRLGYEYAMFSGVEVGLPGWQRAHSQGQGTGHESAFGILYAPEEVNQAYQNRGVEQHIRDLFQQIDPSVSLRLTTETVAHPGTLRLESVTYRIDAVQADGSHTRLTEVRIEVQDARDDPRVHISAESYAGLQQFLTHPEGRPPGTEPARTDPTPLFVGPLRPRAAAVSDAIGRTLERLDGTPELAAYRAELLEAQRRLRQNPGDDAIANAQETIRVVEQALDR